MIGRRRGPDPLTVACRACEAPARATCVRLGGPYGQGQPLRRAHPVRYADARQHAQEEVARIVRRTRA